MDTTIDTLSPRQYQVLNALLRGVPLVQAASAYGVGESTIRHWKRQPDFANALDTMYQDLRAALQEEIIQTCRAGLTALRELMGKSSIADAVKERAVRTALQCMRFVQHEEKLALEPSAVLAAAPSLPETAANAAAPPLHRSIQQVDRVLAALPDYQHDRYRALACIIHNN